MVHLELRVIRRKGSCKLVESVGHIQQHVVPHHQLPRLCNPLDHPRKAQVLLQVIYLSLFTFQGNSCLLVFVCLHYLGTVRVISSITKGTCMTLSPPSLAMEERLVSGNRSLAV